MNFIKKRARFLLIIIFSGLILCYTISQKSVVNKGDGNINTIYQLLKITSGGFLIYGIIQCFRVK